MPSGSSSAAPLLGASRGGGSNGRSSGTSNQSARNRQAELAAAFGDGSDDEDEDEIEPGYGRRIDSPIFEQAPTHPAASSLSSSPPQYSAASPQREHDDVFFDAGDALGQAQSDRRANASASDPLGANIVNADRNTTAPRGTFGAQAQSQSGNVDSTTDSATGVRQHSYDFERASYFAPPRPNASRQSSMVPAASSNGIADQDTTIDMSGVEHGGASASNMSRVRQALGRFGRLVGMRVPGATYSSLNGEDEHPAVARRRIMGSGIGQDGVFANLNAKPERRRRRSGDDRGDDDDLADDVLPPSYETAAADAAPPYWETTIIGGPGGFHPLAPGGAGWTPGGAHVGALEDLIVEGLPLGNFFGFAWNLLVSMSFQFIGFLLTYLLHTTHAARCGSRAGLSITLVQYGFYLRTRAAQMAEGKLPDDILGPGAEPTPTGDMPNGAIGAWFDGAGPQETAGSEDIAHKLLARSFDFVFRQATEATVTSSVNDTFADALASDDGTINLPSPESMSASTEWLAYILMGMGWFILLTSLLSYWRVHRWGKQLVDAAHRENENTTTSADGTTTAATTQEGGDEQRDSDQPVGFLFSLRNAMRNGRRSRRQARAHSAEDWVIFPGRPRRDLFSPLREDRRQNSSSGGDDGDLESGNLTEDERRLLEDMRHAGLIN